MTFTLSQMTFTLSQMSFTFSMLVGSAWTGPPVLAGKLALAGTPTQPCQPHRYSSIWPLHRLTFLLKNVKDIQKIVKDV